MNAVQASRNLWTVSVVPGRKPSKAGRQHAWWGGGQLWWCLSWQRAGDLLCSCKGLSLQFPKLGSMEAINFRFVPELVTVIWTGLSCKPETMMRMFLCRHLFLALSQCKVGQIKHYPIWNSLWKCEQNVKLINLFSCPSCMTVMKTEQIVLWQNASNY